MAHQTRVEPMDAFNEQIVQYTHPPDWINPTPVGRYYLVVIGAGTAGLVTAAIGAGLGARVALIEKHLLGGDCLNVGCVLSKALISASRAAARARAGARITTIGSTIHPYPTRAEVFRKAADAFNRKRLTPGRKRVLARLMAALR